MVRPHEPERLRLLPELWAWVRWPREQGGGAEEAPLLALRFEPILASCSAYTAREQRGADDNRNSRLGGSGGTGGDSCGTRTGTGRGRRTFGPTHPGRC